MSRASAAGSRSAFISTFQPVPYADVADFSVNVFYRINQERLDSPGADAERAKQEREFKIGSIGLSDSTGILMASLLAVPTEIRLCKAQVARGKMFCQSL